MTTQFKVIEDTNPGDFVEKLAAWRTAMSGIQTVEYRYSIASDEAGMTYSVLLIWESIDG